MTIDWEREGEIYRNVGPEIDRRQTQGWIVQYNVISYLLLYGLTVHAVTNMVLRTFVLLQKTVQSPRWVRHCGCPLKSASSKTTLVAIDSEGTSDSVVNYG